MKQIRSNLTRQLAGFELLFTLLEEEFSHLEKRDTDKVVRTEFSVQELLRQLGMERESLAALVRKKTGENFRLSAMLGKAGHDDGELPGLLAEIQKVEQKCARQAAVNAEISIALAEQGRSLLNFLQQEFLPKGESTYSARGRVNRVAAGPTIVRGRL